MIISYNSNDTGYPYCIPNYKKKGSCVALLDTFDSNLF